MPHMFHQQIKIRQEGAAALPSKLHGGGCGAQEQGKSQLGLVHSLIATEVVEKNA